MSNALLIYFEDASAEEFHWSLTKAEGTSSGRDSLTVIAGLDHDRLTVLIAGEDVLVRTVPRPPGREGQVRKAVPFVLEEYLACEVDDVHLVSASCSADPSLLVVAAIDRKLFAAILSRLEEAGLSPDQVLADFLALPGDDGEMVLLTSPERFLAREADLSGAAMAVGNLAVWLDLHGGTGPENLVVYDCAKGDVHLPEGDGVRVKPGPAQWRRLLSVGPKVHPLNLVSGDYRKRRRAGLPMTLITPFVLLFAWLIVLLVGDLVDYHHLARAEEETRAEMVSVYKEVFPGPGPVIAPRLQMEQGLRKSKSRGDGFLSLVGGVAPEILPANGFHLLGLKYDGRRLALEVELASLAEMDRIRKSIVTRTGREVSTGSISRSAKGVRGELRIAAGGGR